MPTREFKKTYKNKAATVYIRTYGWLKGTTMQYARKLINSLSLP